MKVTKTLTEMAVELEAQKARKHDVIVEDRDITVLTSPETGQTEVALRPNGETIATLDPQHLFMRQLGTHLGIRADFADRLRKQPTYAPVFDGLVNGMLQRMHVEKGAAQEHMVRTYLPGEDGGNGVARAILGKGYRRIDNVDIAEAVLPVIINEMPGAVIEGCELTDSKMYLKVLADNTVDLKSLIQPGLHRFLPDGPDNVQAAFILTNSEVGAASFSIEHMLLRLVCTNGLIVSKSMSRRHVGSKQVEVGEDFAIFSDATQRKSDEALMAQIADVVRHTLNEERFRSLAQQFADTLDSTPVEAPRAAMQVLAPKVGLTDGEGESVLTKLLEEGPRARRKFHVINAITAAAQDVESYDRSVEMEQIGGRVMAMAPAEWEAVALATA